MIMKLSEPLKFAMEFEPSLVSGTYLWIDSEHVIYDKSEHNIFMDIDYDEVCESLSFTLNEINLVLSNDII